MLDVQTCGGTGVTCACSNQNPFVLLPYATNAGKCQVDKQYFDAWAVNGTTAMYM